MRKYVGLFLFLLVIEQAAQMLVNALVPSGFVLWLPVNETLLISLGHVRHYPDLYSWLGQAQLGSRLALFFAACYVAEVMKAALITRRGLNLACLLLALELATQMISMLTRGYVINYMGYGNKVINFGEIMHLGDILYFIGSPMMPVFTVILLVELFVRKLRKEI